MSEISEIVDNFNTVTLELLNQIVKIYPESLVANNTYRAKTMMKISKTK